VSKFAKQSDAKSLVIPKRALADFKHIENRDRYKQWTQNRSILRKAQIKTNTPVKTNQRQDTPGKELSDDDCELDIQPPVKKPNPKKSESGVTPPTSPRIKTTAKKANAY
jgi:hypothetical protein